MDVEQGLREYLEIKASVAYLKNELNLLQAKGQAGAAAYGTPAVGDGMAGQEEGVHGGRAWLAAKLESRRSCSGSWTRCSAPWMKGNGSWP